jgi:hypothetical protein
VHHVEPEEILAQIFRRAPEEAEYLEFDAESRVRFEEPADHREVLAARGRHETNARTFFPAGIEDIAFEFRVAGVGQEQRSARGDDLWNDQVRGFEEIA